ncbi:MAG: hypothetical protein IKH52_00395 [Bacteroidaceae bacterium]|nr:hypothetical protein [Bacteroidaceae bacterium]MBR6925664.1 hypothetical protein [Bacteroidaceae bacterium]MBR7028389.1 hypothetical protein [Bacteroidaceae bacterium]
MTELQRERIVYLLFSGLLKALKIAIIILMSYFFMTYLLEFPLWMTALVAIGIVILI